jgi:ribonuclease BN (tRNA processing enzyme)
MLLHVVGCSPAWHNPGGAQSGYLVEEDGRRLLLDCGPGVLARLRELEQWPRVDAIAITHLHLDHWGDLVPWAYGALYGGGAGVPRPELWLPPGAVDELRTMTRIGGDVLLDVFPVHTYEEGTPFEAAGFEVTPLPARHYELASFGFRVTNNGSVLAYSADSAPSEHLAELGRDADLYLLEATLAQPEDGIRGHLTEREALDAFHASGARRLIVIHRPDELPLTDGVERAYDGLRLEI